MRFEEVHPGALVVHYTSAETMAPEHQRALLARLEVASGPVALIFKVDSGVAGVPVAVPTFWLGVTGRRELQIRAVAIVTNAMLVRVAARGFALANVARGAAIAVETFDSVDTAVAWSQAQLAG